MNTTQAIAAILTAARQGNGDFCATKRTTARFCTEALADCAADLIIPTRYASESVPTWRTLTRDEALFRLAAWSSWLGLERQPGRHPASRLADLCKRRLAMVEAEAEIVARESRGRGGCTVIEGGRSASYLRERTGQLLKIAMAAGDQWVTWG